jgi:hypothetical protein
MTPQRFYAVFGLLLLMAGIAFDFGFLAPTVTRAFKVDASAYLSSFPRYIHDLARTYMLVLGVVNLVMSVLASRPATSRRQDWMVCLLIVVGSIVLIATAFWYASAGPSFKWEMRCSVLTIGLVSLLLGLGLQAYRVARRQ